MSLELLNAVKHHTIAHRPQETLKLRIGIHTGKIKRVTSNKRFILLKFAKVKQYNTYLKKKKKQAP